MTEKNFKQWSHSVPSRLNHHSDYVMHELENHAQSVIIKLESKLDKNELKEFYDSIEKRLDEKASRSEFLEVAERATVIAHSLESLVVSINALSSNVSTTLKILLDKLDTDTTAQNIAVASSQLDENYEETIL